MGIYPPPCENDLIYFKPEWAYSPRISFFESARIIQDKAVGLVFTCEFPHATPAGTSTHWYDRSDYTTIQQQMVHNSIDVLIGGGAGLLTKEQESFLQKNGYEVFRDEIDKLKNTDSPKIWALFGEKHMANDLDRDPSKQTSDSANIFSIFGAVLLPLLALFFINFLWFGYKTTSFFLFLLLLVLSLNKNSITYNDNQAVSKKHKSLYPSLSLVSGACFDRS